MCEGGRPEGDTKGEFGLTLTGWRGLEGDEGDEKKQLCGLIGAEDTRLRCTFRSSFRKRGSTISGQL